VLQLNSRIFNTVGSVKLKEIMLALLDFAFQSLGFQSIVVHDVDDEI